MLFTAKTGTQTIGVTFGWLLSFFACALFPCEQGNFTHAKRKSTTEALCPHGAYAFLEIITQLNDADRIQGCVNVQISASGTSPVKPDDFGMRGVPKHIERLIVSRS